MKHKKKLILLLTLVACMVLLFSFPVCAAELTEVHQSGYCAQAADSETLCNLSGFILNPLLSGTVYLHSG